jgi:hypothetical protein
MTEAVSAVQPSISQRPVAELFRRSLAAHKIFFAIAAFYCLAACLSAALYPLPRLSVLFQVLVGIFISGTVIALLAMSVREFIDMIRSEKPASPVRRLLQRMSAVLTDPVRMAAGVPMFVAFTLFVFAFSLLKGQITAMVPFAWDSTFDQWDRSMHFGHRPWELLHAALGSGPATMVINLNYNAWFMVMKLMLLHFAFYAAPGELRTHFFLTFMAMWLVGGTVLATYFSSAGPCYFEAIGLGSAAYGPLLERLRAINETWPIWALDTQNLLWSLKENGSPMGGISAMPSMHNATSLFFVFVAWRWAGWLRLAFIAHAILIFIGSVHLGWHYAVDAYLAFAIAIVAWFAMKPVSRWWHARPAVVLFDREFAERTAG